METHILGNGVYSYAEASELTRVSYRRVHSWFKGRRDRLTAPLLTSAYSKGSVLSFLDLIEVLVAGQLRAHKVSMNTLRRAYRSMAEYLQTDHPFSRQELLTDGQNVFVQISERTGEKELIELVSNQHIIRDVLLPYLDRVDFDTESLLACRWNIADGVVIDPSRSYGKPIVESCAMPTSILAAAYEANNRDAGRVADWYGVTQADVERAVSFEKGETGIAA